MHAGIYKPGQGYWTRTMSAIAFSLLILMGAVWVWDLAGAMDVAFEEVYLSGSAALVFITVCGWLLYYFIGRKPRVVDFMIATEGEMKKVNWSTKKEIMSSTWVVIGLTIFIALTTFVCDQGFALFFRWVGVLEDAPVV